MKKYLAILCLSFLALYACSEDAKEELLTTDISAKTVQQILAAEDATAIADQSLSQIFEQLGLSSKEEACYTLTLQENGFVATFTDCAINSTENINGSLAVVYGIGNDPYTYRVTYTDFYVGDIKINGTRTVLLEGGSLASPLPFTVASDVQLTLADGSQLTESGTRSFSVIAEEGLATYLNLSGNWMVVTDGDSYLINADMSKAFTCAYWAMGSLQISKNELKTTVDFGDGSCDNQATVTYPDGSTKNISL